jgi:hypothetical protein
MHTLTQPATGFQAILPRVRTHAAIRFRHLADERREEAAAETVAAAYAFYQRLAEKNRLHEAHPSVLADLAARHAAQHRHLGTRQSSRDVLSPITQKRRGIRVRSLTPAYRHGWRELVLACRRVDPSEQAAFNLDFERWLAGFDRRLRRIITALAAGASTGEVARRFGITAGRVSQLRRRFERSWQIFQGQMLQKAA